MALRAKKVEDELRVERRRRPGAPRKARRNAKRGTFVLDSSVLEELQARLGVSTAQAAVERSLDMQLEALRADESVRRALAAMAGTEAEEGLALMNAINPSGNLPPNALARLRAAGFDVPRRARPVGRWTRK